MPASLCLDLLLILTVVTAACNDLVSRRIPNKLLLASAIGAIVVHLFGPAPGDSLVRALSGAATGLALFLPLYILRGMAAGDVKLMAVTGLFLSAGETAWLAVLTVCAGGVMALVSVLWRGRGRDALANIRVLLRPIWAGLAGVHLAAEPLPRPSVGSLPYGLAIACATLFYISFRHG